MRLSPVLAGVAFLLLTAAVEVCHAQESPWWEAVGLDPIWLGSGPLFEPGSSNASVESHNAVDLRKPLRTDPSETRGRFVPCTDTGYISLCGGSLFDLAQSSMGGPDWSVAPKSSFSPGLEGAVRANLYPLEATGTLRSGTGVVAQSVGLQAKVAGASLLAGAGRTQRWSGLEIATPSGSIGLPWNDVADSGYLGMSLPIGPFSGSTSLWGTDRSSPLDSGLADSGRSLGWSVGLSVPSWHGAWEMSLWREDRSLSTTGRLEGKVFHQQTFSSARAEARLHWTGGDWEVQAGTRQYRLDAPQGDLGEPTLAWNRLSDQSLSSLYAAEFDQQDYWSGSLQLDRWDAGFRHTWRWSALSVRAGLSAYLWTFQADLRIRRLRVVGLIPAVSLDPLASGQGWFAASGPEASISWNLGEWGKLDLSGSWSAPLDGNWHDHLGGSGGNPSRTSLPLDPWSLWSVGLAWSQ